MYIQMKLESKNYYGKSETHIRQVAESWDLHFAGVSELKSLGGPFCVNAAFQHTDSSFLFFFIWLVFMKDSMNRYYPSITGFGDQDIHKEAPHFLLRYVPNGNPIYFVEKLLYPFFFRDHIPSQYFQGLQRASIYYEK
ncbi:uncharacterized protein BX663DRAFT_541633 [Cokeromyces recurvatus]|uniref:uncharacterized protein n=1 Tax=Cokeromyces recurvatus TaxID=90255 RepID=UPI002220599F|nr:uncharacterized protein BX663DRAFT_541633 [Cokeromyces recurvatus]KAI7904630.1 hypothetical protein BX663DRAFT_541633 [Cokeromyces recurvatus]